MAPTRRAVQSLGGQGHLFTTQDLGPDTHDPVIQLPSGANAAG